MDPFAQDDDYDSRKRPYNTVYDDGYCSIRQNTMTSTVEKDYDVVFCLEWERPFTMGYVKIRPKIIQFVNIFGVKQTRGDIPKNYWTLNWNMVDYLHILHTSEWANSIQYVQTNIEQNFKTRRTDWLNKYKVNIDFNIESLSIRSNLRTPPETARTTSISFIQLPGTINSNRIGLIMCATSTGTQNASSSILSQIDSLVEHFQILPGKQQLRNMLKVHHRLFDT
ncbi:unnamed protein product [Didymodactylos carnosus]|uniref:Uncharacterized protein n=1 Tax=Didymodactylos carnosus TaxID=1234261 RepID=A0A814JUE1_9BILA|nr:unnamed protein product [Didymodactylos carnosus]CAF1042306.1 unnamed protein product [Didymodactylos carnosus]CAF3690482.1 unnamed protein product [Didymodactylos carnosus]CAF3812463.1 unnamed protein product [Didymodactylos carnosus]